MVFADIYVDSIVTVGTAYFVCKWQVHYLGVLSEPPYISLVSGETRAVYAALLAGADAYCLSVFDVAHGVALRVFKGDEGNDEVPACFVGECFVFCGDVLEERRVVEVYLVAPLFECHSEHLLALYLLGYVVGVDFYHVIRAFALVFEYLDCLGSVVGRYHSVAHLALYQCGRGGVAGIAQGHEVTVRAHAVRSSGTCVCACYW